MAEIHYALIKNNIVENIGLFDSPSEELIEFIKNDLGLDYLIPANHKTQIGGTYDGAKFWPKQPYSSWIKNEETNEWESPIPYPAVEEGSDEQYIWDENSTSWLLLPPSN